MQKGAVVVITGADAGVGRATARAFAREGACLGLLARNLERLETTRREVEALGGRAICVVADVAAPDQVEAAATRIEQELGPIEIWINNAMTTIFAPFLQITPQDFKRVTEVTYLGFVHGSMAALRRMKARDRGVIVQVGSALAYRAIPLQSAYCGAKHAMAGFTESVRCELLHEKSHVRITMVHLPAINTPQFDWCKTVFHYHPQPAGKTFQPEVAARAILYAARHPQRREYFLGGDTVKAVWGDKFIPAWLDWLMAKIAWDGQLDKSRPTPDNRPNNLYEPVAGHFGAHGSFNRTARRSSLQWWLVENRRPLGAMGTALAALWLFQHKRTR